MSLWVVFVCDGRLVAYTREDANNDSSLLRPHCLAVTSKSRDFGMTTTVEWHFHS